MKTDAKDALKLTLFSIVLFIISYGGLKLGMWSVGWGVLISWIGLAFGWPMLKMIDILVHNMDETNH